MHDKHYPLVSYRLSEKIINIIKVLHKETGLTYNLLFTELTKKAIRKIAYKNKKL